MSFPAHRMSVAPATGSLPHQTPRPRGEMGPPPRPSQVTAAQPRPAGAFSRPSSALSNHSATSSRSSRSFREAHQDTPGVGRARTVSKAGEGGAGGRAGGEGENVNIEVFVRCRGRSAKEIAEESPIIITTSGALGDSLTIETARPTSVVPSLTSSSATRTCSFNKVFGPEADQSMVFETVVKDTLNEVMMGYNCTIFAYGQTGTGKTYTMQGDLTPTILGGPSSEAGIVPRTLYGLFSLLDDSGFEYSVKISYIELYNEEIRDLLAADGSNHQAAAPSSSSGGAASGGAFKIYDDKNGGVRIQGLKECFVKDAEAGIMQLRKGSARRETGETLMNKTSSRSHSIFSITVRLNKSSQTGEDILKIGKFNLVDLAGSENIRRSGAQDIRAREAGIINQSLFTLGRVIDALVDRAKHVPYRDSKLTRLLQDSLGGKTKTRLIATISPSRSNQEETLSTIDYATKATRIENKPEVNETKTISPFLEEKYKALKAEVEHLKAQVAAQRPSVKSSFQESNAELESKKLQELHAQLEIQERGRAQEMTLRVAAEEALNEARSEANEKFEASERSVRKLRSALHESMAKSKELEEKYNRLAADGTRNRPDAEEAPFPSRTDETSELESGRVGTDDEEYVDEGSFSSSNGSAASTDPGILDIDDSNLNGRAWDKCSTCGRLLSNDGLPSAQEEEPEGVDDNPLPINQAPSSPPPPIAITAAAVVVLPQTQHLLPDNTASSSSNTGRALLADVTNSRSIGSGIGGGKGEGKVVVVASVKGEGKLKGRKAAAEPRGVNKEQSQVYVDPPRDGRSELGRCRSVSS